MRKKWFLWGAALCCFWLLGGCALAKEKKQDYGVFIGGDGSRLKEMAACSRVVLDAENFTKEEIQRLESQGCQVFCYVNIGSFENFREDYQEFALLKIADYEGWEEEVWVDVTDPVWQKRVENWTKRCIKKGVSGIFVDNLDVYDAAPSQETYQALLVILQKMNQKAGEVMVNGGKSFLIEAMRRGESIPALCQGVNQESVFYTGEGIPQPKEETREYLEYLKKLQETGVKVYLIEYVHSAAAKNRVEKEGKKRKFTVFSTGDIELR